MDYDIYGLAAFSKKGEYFRNNVWWRALWDYITVGRPYQPIVLRELRQELEALELGHEPDSFLTKVRQKLLESYKNGIETRRSKSSRRPGQFKKSKASK